MIEKARVFTLHAPAGAQLTGNGSAVDLNNAHNVVVVAEFHKGATTAVTLTPQRNDAAGTNWEVFTRNMRIWRAANLATSDTLVRAADAVNLTTAAVNTAHRVVFQINPDSLGLHSTSDDPCTQFRVVVSGGNANDRGSITAYLTPSRYKP